MKGREATTAAAQQSEQQQSQASPQKNNLQPGNKSSLPYTNAVINECQRLCNLFPENLPHRTTRDVVICGHQIAKGTLIVPQICCVLYDEQLFPNAQELIPERFLDSQGQLKKCEELIPFSIGKRQCLGESLARMELFLFAANLFNHFEITPVDPMKPPSTEKLME
uniref:Cytochrome P450 n=1 Tax=Ditylenchus dipsaci TaxID=166011 RepID=A0A915DW26_9BILA